jgi:hypothetical protein
MESGNTFSQSDAPWIQFADVLVDTGVIAEWIEWQGRTSQSPVSESAKEFLRRSNSKN